MSLCPFIVGADVRRLPFSLEAAARRGFALVALAASLFAVAPSRAATVTWDVTVSTNQVKYKYTPVDAANAKPGMDTVLSKAKIYLNDYPTNTLLLSFPAGTYYFYHSNTFGIWINTFTNGSLVLHGAGTNVTTLVFDQFDELGLYVYNSSRITVEQMLLTRSGLYVSQGEVVSVQPGRVRFQVHQGFPDPVWLFNLGGSASYERTLIGFTHEDPLDPHLDPSYAKVKLNDLLSVGAGQYDALLANTNEQPPWPVGQWLAQKCKCGAHTVRFESCDDCIVQDVRFTRAAGNPLRATGENNRMLVRRVSIERSEPINGRAPCFSGPAGGPQIYCGVGGATIQECVVVGTADDGIAYFSHDPAALATNGVLRANTVRDNQARGIVIASSAGGICQSNTLMRNDDSAVLIINFDHGEGASEGYPNASVCNWTIANNTFIQAWVNPVISLENQCTNAGRHDNIDIVSNLFVQAPRNNHLVYVDNANEIRINQNSITSFSNTNDYCPDTTGNALVYVNDGTWIHGTRNTYLQSTSRSVSQKLAANDVIDITWSFFPLPSLQSIGVTDVSESGRQVTLRFADLQPGYAYIISRSLGLGAWCDAATFLATNTPGTWSELVTNQPAAFYKVSCPLPQ